MSSRFVFILFVLMISPAHAGEFREQLAQAGAEQTQESVIYDPTYFRIAFPGGDVPKDRGVCTDVIIRAYRALGIDLQLLVHQDMLRHFSKYPKIWGLKRPDTNIDHRRVPNLQTFFKWGGAGLAVSGDANDYRPGDLVTWNLHFKGGPVLPHIGMVVNQKSPDGKRFLVVHNIGRGPELEDILEELPMAGGHAAKTGHYFYKPK